VVKLKLVAKNHGMVLVLLLLVFINDVQPEVWQRKVVIKVLVEWYSIETEGLHGNPNLSWYP